MTNLPSANTSVIPIFPLPTVIFPGEVLNLHIFENRYKLMVGERIASNNSSKLDFFDGLPIHFGITLATESSNFLTGCSICIEKITKKYANGNLDVRTRGVRRYTTEEVVSRTPFPMAKVQYFDDLVDDKKDDHEELINQASTLHSKLVEIFEGEPPNITIPENQEPSFYFAHTAGLKNEQKQSLLEIKKESKRLEYLINHYRTVIPHASTMQEIKTQVMLNGHLRTLKPGDL